MKDYVRNPKPRNARNRKGARGKQNNPPVPTGKIVIALILLIGFGGFLYHISGSSQKEEPTTQDDTTKSKPVPIEQQRPAKEQFDYMQMLQNKEVPVELPDGSVVADPSTDPQLLAHQQEMQSKLRQQQDRAKQLAAEQNGKLPTETTNGGQVTTVQAGKVIPLSEVKQKPAATEANTSARTGETVKTDPRKPQSFATVIASESAKKQQAEQKTKAEKEQILAMFSQNNKAPAKVAESQTTATGNRKVMMQCGAFRTAEQANSLGSRINSQGMHAVVHQGSSASGVWNRVMLGPYASRAEAESALARLKSSGTVSSCTIFAQ